MALLLIPQSMAYAGIAGLPAVHGLYAAMLPPIVAAFFVSSPYLQTGPVAMTAILSFGALSTLATPLTPEYIGLAALLALVVGVARVLTGVLHAGFVVSRCVATRLLPPYHRQQGARRLAWPLQCRLRRQTA